MVAAIGSSILSNTPATGSGDSTVALEAQLARYRKELSECANCESARTSEGKAAIRLISNKISVIEARIEKIAADNIGAQKTASQNLPAAKTTAAHDLRQYLTLGSQIDLAA